MSDMKFVTAINCMDGRVQMPIIEWMKQKNHIDFVDMITEPGPNKILAENKKSFDVDFIKKRVEISVKKHGSTLIAIVGHYDCAGNPVNNKIQKQQITSSVKTIQSWGFNVSVIGLWIDDQWKVHKII
ncbi:MAG: carbonic anhydrase [Methanobacteriota archaeon]